MTGNTSTDFIPDLPSGPLDDYRKTATFDWKKMKIVLENPEKLKLKLRLWQTLEKDPLFQHTNSLSSEQLKRLSALRVKKFLKYDFIPQEPEKMSYSAKTKQLMTVNEALVVLFPDVSIKLGLGYSLFTNAILSLGTERHEAIYKSAWDGQIFAGFALTEIAHGSNTKNMKTTATYDSKTQEFIVNTPDFESAKCYVGNLGKTCTMVLLLAQLYTEGENRGLHVFLCPVRDPRTLLPYPGIIVGDIGEKGGINGVDNGFIMFNNFRIPREYLLNRTADVTPEGIYESSFTDPGRILGAALEMLSAARVAIVQENTCIIASAVTIAIRYAALRKQFGNKEGEEVALIEYPLHQRRLFPYVAASYVFKLFTKSLTDIYVNTVERSNRGDKIDNLSDIISEIHAMVSTAKPLITWTCRDAIQECREACGGFGYLKAARLTDMRADQDPSVTYEGDNNVLGQQTAKWLLKQWSSRHQVDMTSPLGTCMFFKDGDKILKNRCRAENVQDVDSRDFITISYQWLICWLSSTTHTLQSTYTSSGDSLFTAKNSTCTLTAPLTRAYCEHLVLHIYWEDNGARSVILQRLGRLYGLWSLRRHLAHFYEGGYAQGGAMARLVMEGIGKLCGELKGEMVGLVDALSPSDYVLNSVLGRSDGQLYLNLQSEFFHNEGNLTRANWWKEIADPNAPDIRKLISKL